MQLWIAWWSQVSLLEGAFSRKRTFLWFALCIAGITIRKDFAGVSSIIRSLGLQDIWYDRLLDCFHSKAINLETLTILWVKTIRHCCARHLLMVNGRIVLLADGIKIPKAGKKMPAVKKLHQESESNTKPEFIFGHSCQAISLVAGCLETFFAIPLACRIHEGVIVSNRDKRTLLDKMMSLLFSLNIDAPCYFVADAYYASRGIAQKLLRAGKDHLISRVRSNAVAYYPVTKAPREKNKVGRPSIYGKKIKLMSLFADQSEFVKTQSPVYGERTKVISYRCVNLLCRPIGNCVRYVLVVHPLRGRIILMTTDLELDPVEVIRLYGIRFKIEVSFKQAVHTIGTYNYHFWMQAMTRLKRKSGNQHLHHKSEEYRKCVARKIKAYHLHIMAGIIAQGLMQYLSMAYTNIVWTSFGSWIRTIRPGVLPSEMVVASAMRYSLPEFLKDSNETPIIAKFIREKIDLDRTEGVLMTA